MFVLLAVGRFGLSSRGWGSFPLLTALALGIVLDLQSRIIPDLITLPAIAYALLLALARGGAPGLAEGGLGAVAAGGGVWLLAIVSRGGIGGGDIKLTAMLGAALGWKGALIAFALSQIAAGVVLLILVAVRRRRPGEAFPVGALIALFGALILIASP